MNRFYLKSCGYTFFAIQILHFNILKQLNEAYNFLHLWISICLAVSLILWQTFTIKEENTKHYYIVLFEIIFLSFMLNLMFVPTYGLFDCDPQYEFNLVKTIQQYGWSIDLDSKIYMPMGGFSYWPFLSFFIISISNVTGISLLNSARYIPSLWSTIALFFIFLMSNMLYRNKRVALLATLLFSTSYNYFYFSSMLVKSSFAFVLFSLTIYLYLRSITKKSRTFRFLAVITLLTMVLSHHFTGLIMITFMILFTLTTNLSNILPRYFQRYIEVKKTSPSLDLNFTILTFCAIVGYWTFLILTPLRPLVFGIKNFFNPGIFFMLESPWGGPWFSESNLRIWLYNNSLRATLFLAVGLLLYSFFFRRIRKLKEIEVGMLVFTGLMFILYVLIQYGYTIRIIYGERFLTFGWFFILPIISSNLMYLHKKQGSSKGRIFCIVFILVYLTMNFTALEPYYYYNSSDIPFDRGFTRQSFKPEWYAISDFFDDFLSNQTVHQGRRYIGKVQTDRGISDILSTLFPGAYRTDPRIFKEGNTELLRESGTNWVIIHEEMFRVIKPTLLDRHRLREEQVYLTSMAIEKLRNSDAISKIYSNGPIDIYLVRQDG